MKTALLLLLLAFVCNAGTARGQIIAYQTSATTVLPKEEMRYCGAPLRNADGTIARSSAVLSAFKRAHPCPATGLSTGACPGWIMDHVIPLACGGCDAVANLQWLPTDLWKQKSLFERDAGVYSKEACK